MNDMAGHGSVTMTLEGSNRSTTLPLLPGTIGPSVADIRKLYGELGIFTFDPGYGGTAACDSKITYIDGDEGILLLPRLPDRPACRDSRTSSRSAYLLLNGELPTAAADATSSITA